MTAFIIASGALVVALAVVDAFWTALAPAGGAGPVTRAMSRLGWRLGRRLLRGPALAAVGPVLLAVGVFGWILLLATGWVLVFSGDPGSLLYTRQPDTPPADLSGRIWFVVYTLFTVGNGDYTPDGDVYQVVASAVPVTGMVVVTLTVTYLLNVVSAVVRARTLGSQLSGLGGSAEEIVANAWDGSGVPGIDLQLTSVSAAIDRFTEDHRAYPLLHYYRAPARERAAEPGLAALDDALTLLAATEAAPPPSILAATRSSIESYADEAGGVFRREADGPPPAPDTGRLRRAGLVADETALAAALEASSSRRRALHRIVAAKGWRWPAAS